MDATPIQTKTVLTAIAAVAVLEAFAAKISAHIAVFSLAHLGILRVVESAVIIIIIVFKRQGLGVIGLERSRLAGGTVTGLKWSTAFAVAAGAGMLGLYLLKYNPLDIIRVPLPRSIQELVLFFFVGGLIAPIAEEIFFRGILFGYFFNWGTIPAVTLSTIIFVFFHPQAGITQAVGGVVFALAYHFSRSLAAPIVIHSLGNLALFSISLFSKSL